MALLPSAGEERRQPPSSYETAGYPAIGHDRGVSVRRWSIGCPVRPGITLMLPRYRALRMPYGPHSVSGSSQTSAPCRNP